ncbi:hypothetical protein Fmac_022787 [Flemingia macrophylla]|uniref:DUF7610 domain-containing protein n=1 Tax=Flemingia macrophylla TaxID=520843 RepID=A0ABD1M2I5_9FABA
MTKRYKNLQARLQELTCILEEALLLSPESESYDSISNDIKHKLGFIGKLLSAEVASHPSEPHHLHHMSERLNTLEREFHNWDSFRSLPYHDFDKDSTCSCTDSCLNDDGDETELIAFETPQEFLPDSNCEKAEATGCVDEDKKTGEMDELASAEDLFEDFDGYKEHVEYDGALLIKTNGLEREERVGNKCCALAAGVVIGIIFMAFIMVNVFNCFRFVEQVGFAAPT